MLEELNLPSEQANWLKDDQLLKAKITSILMYLENNYFKNTRFSLQAAEALLQRVRETQDATTIAITLDFIGRAYAFMGQGDKALVLKQEALKFFEQLGDYNKQADILSDISSILWSVGDFDRALALAYDSLKMAKQAGNQNTEAWILNFLGNYYYDLQNYPEALQYYEQALPLFQLTEDTLGEGRVYIGLASVLIKMKVLKQAEVYCLRCMTIYEKREQDGIYGISRIFLELGNIAIQRKNFTEAELFFKKSLRIREKLKTSQAIVSSLMALGNLYKIQEKNELALAHLEKASDEAQKIGAKAKLYDIYLQMSEVYEQRGEYAESLHFFKQFYTIKSEILGNQADAKIKNLQAQMEVERSEKEAEIQRLRNIELQKAYEEIEEKNQQITESITYAQRIQEAMLPSKQELQKFEDKAFVLFLPRDIVSGDFYWFAQKGENYLFAAVDCTGHGVPGAFMSMIADSLLNQIIHDKEEHRPAQILQEMHQGIRNALKQSETANSDGMDMSVVNLDAKNKVLSFAGAKSPLVYIQENRLFHIKGDKYAVGGEQREYKRNFTAHEISLEKPTIFYLFSDGFQDQFGGEANKKFMTRRLRELFFAIHHLPMLEQQEKLLQTFQQWKGSLPQIDDVMILGVKAS